MGVFAISSQITITAVSAKNLVAADMNGYSDPYCTINRGSVYNANSQDKSQIIKKNLNPVWNYKSRQWTFDSTDEFLVTVWDHDKIGSDDYLGETIIKITQDQAKHNNTFEITQDLVAGSTHKKSKVTGSVTFQIAVSMPSSVLNGATFTFIGNHPVDAFGLINNQNPATGWEGTGVINVKGEVMEFEFANIKRECFQESGKPWIYNGPISFASNDTMKMKESKGWPAKIEYTANRIRFVDNNLTKMEMDITDSEKYYGGTRTTSGKWNFTITLKQ
eukprot:TRINITY_DN10151_c0_g1_i1.p1 TRINITY_DN10151_c0_g1~~TRINITY_DN10151_c0_g1_i1.p1  ORF type:complete len:276 (-),score=72.27 TRINITY_DN10151_c0_g1_i1:13-840(-)